MNDNHHLTFESRNYLHDFYLKYNITFTNVRFPSFSTKKGYLETFVKDYSPDYYEISKIENEDDYPEHFRLNIDGTYEEWLHYAKRNKYEFTYYLPCINRKRQKKSDKGSLTSIIQCISDFFKKTLLQGIEINNIENIPEIKRTVETYMNKDDCDEARVINNLFRDLISTLFGEIPNKENKTLLSRNFKNHVTLTDEDFYNTKLYKEITSYKLNKFSIICEKIEQEQNRNKIDNTLRKTEEEAFYLFKVFFENYLRPRRLWFNTVFSLNLPLTI